MTPDFDKTCFVIMPFGDLDNKDEKCLHFNAVYENIKKAVEKSEIGLKCIRADDIHKSGNVNEDIIEYLYKSKMVIADISSENTNVTYELGIRHSLKHNTVLIAQIGTKLPFDFDNERTIFYNKKLQLSDAIDRLSKYVAGNNNGSNHKDSPVLKLISKNTNMMELSRSSFDYKTEILGKIEGGNNKAYTAKLDNDHYLLGIDASIGNINRDNFDISSFNKLVESTLQEYNLNRNSILGYYNPKNYELGVKIEKESPSCYYSLDFNCCGIVSFSFVTRKVENNSLDLNKMTSVLYDLLSLCNLFFKDQDKLYINSYFDTPKTSSIVDYYPELNGASFSELAELEYNRSEVFKYEKLYEIRTDYIKEHIINFISNFLRICNYQEDPTEIANYFYDIEKIK